MPGSVFELELEGAFDTGRILERLETARSGSRAALLVAEAKAAPTATDADLRALARFELPIVFAFEGALKGPLAEVALSADIRVCSEVASLQGRLAGNARVRALTDEATALALFLGRATLSAEQLLSAGLASSVVTPGAARAEGRRIAEIIASRGPIATRLAKEAVWRGLGQPLEQALRFETDLTLLLQTTKDRAEGVRAFLEKRPPIFTGE